MRGRLDSSGKSSKPILPKAAGNRNQRWQELSEMLTGAAPGFSTGHLQQVLIAVEKATEHSSQERAEQRRLGDRGRNHQVLPVEEDGQDGSWG